MRLCPTRRETGAASPGMNPAGGPWAGRSAMPSGKHLAILRRGVKAWHAWDPERLPCVAGQAVVEDALEGRLCSSGEAVATSALEAVVWSLRKRLANAAAGIRIEAKRGIGYRLITGGDA